MTPPRTDKTRRCEGCQTPIPLSRNTRSKRCTKCQKIFANSRNVTRCALRYVKLKAEGLWPTCSIEGCDREANNGARDALCGPRRTLGARVRTWRYRLERPVVFAASVRPRGASGHAAHGVGARITGGDGTATATR